MKKIKNTKHIIKKNIIFFILFSIAVLFGIIIFNLYSLKPINIEPSEYFITFIILLLSFLFFLSLNWIIKQMEII